MTQPGPTIDLHMHSSLSDGALSPDALVDHAAEHGVHMLALTDHDTVAGIPAARAAATHHGLHLISGVEISVTWRGRTLHIVGLNPDIDHPVLRDGLSWLQQTRRNRARRMAAKLEKAGVPRAFERVRQLAGTGQITRPHFARLLIEDGLCRDLPQAFNRYLRPGKRAHVATQWAELATAIDWIHAAGGQAVLAHPHGYGMSAAWRERMFHAFALAGGDAVEICTGSTSADQVADSARRARLHGLAGSVGTDFHSPDQHWLKPGRLPALPTAITPIWQRWQSDDAPSSRTQPARAQNNGHGHADDHENRHTKPGQNGGHHAR